MHGKIRCFPNNDEFLYLETKDFLKYVFLFCLKILNKCTLHKFSVNLRLNKAGNITEQGGFFLLIQQIAFS